MKKTLILIIILILASAGIFYYKKANGYREIITKENKETYIEKVNYKNF